MRKQVERPKLWVVVHAEVNERRLETTVSSQTRFLIVTLENGNAHAQQPQKHGERMRPPAGYIGRFYMYMANMHANL